MSNNDEFLSGQKPTKSFKDFASKDMAKPPTHAADEYANMQLMLESFEILEGTVKQDGSIKHYKYAVMKCMTQELETVYVRCSGDTVVRQLEMVDMETDLPAYLTLKKDGKAWYLD